MIQVPAAIAATAGSAAAGGTAASILGGLGSFGNLLGGLGGLLGSKGGFSAKDGYKMGDVAYRNAKIMAQNLPTYQMQGWKNAGIHPLAGMGMPTVGPSSFSVGGEASAGDIAAGIGNGVSRAVEAWQSKEERQFARISSALSLENMQLQNDRLRAEIALASSPGTAPGMAVDPFMPGQSVSASGHIPQEFYKALPTPLGTGRAGPAHNIAIDRNGVPMRVLNTDLIGDNDWMQLADLFMSTIPDLAHGYIGKPFSNKFSQMRSRMREFTRPR